MVKAIRVRGKRANDRVSASGQPAATASCIEDLGSRSWGPRPRPGRLSCLVARAAPPPACLSLPGSILRCRGRRFAVRVSVVHNSQTWCSGAPLSFTLLQDPFAGSPLQIDDAKNKGQDRIEWPRVGNKPRWRWPDGSRPSMLVVCVCVCCAHVCTPACLPVCMCACEWPLARPPPPLLLHGMCT